jgi:hypothetical protein
MLRSKLNSEEETGFIEGATDYKVGANQFKLRCGICNALFYVDETTFKNVNNAIEEGIDNPFMCARCEEEYDELSH